MTDKGRKAVLDGTGSGHWHPLPLTDGRFLRVTCTLFMKDSSHGLAMTVQESSFQYQQDDAVPSDQWLVRYDYSYEPGKPPYSQSHVQVNAKLRGHGLPRDGDLQGVHFPTRRMLIEGVIRLLIEDFQVPVHKDHRDIWRSLLAESEKELAGIMRQPPLGPDK